MPEIKPIGQQTVHQICSGQVILDLATAVKELLENSVDAGANIIEIKLKEYGRTCIEVTDNGKGVEENNFEALTLKHHTSKLQDFSDLSSVETFGFRGEALSSLCALCSMSIITRHKNAKVAHRLGYDNDGHIVNKSCAARQPGTTVILRDIFCTLPVRRKEFEKNIKREYGKLLNLLNAYCLISTNVRISCINETGKGNRNVVITTSGGGSILNNISTIFGSKQSSTLLEFKQILPSLEVCEGYFLKHDEAVEFNDQCKITGFISSCGSSLGRNSNDRQFYSVNKRPCEMQKVAKVINEVFHMFNRYQYPFVQLDISTNREEVDVNVTPDKRKIFMQREKYIFAIIKTSLLELFNGQSHAIGFTKPVVSHAPQRSEQLLSHFITKTTKEVGRASEKNDSENFQNSYNHDKKTQRSRPEEISSKSLLSNFNRSSSKDHVNNFLSQCSKKFRKRSCDGEENENITKHRRIDILFAPVKTEDIKHEDNVKNSVEVALLGCNSEIPINKVVKTSFTDRVDKVVVDGPSDDAKEIHKLSFSFSALCRNLKAKAQALCGHAYDDTSSSSRAVFKAKISSDENKKAEAELSKFFSKSSFENMKIIGQFNMGFIVAQHKNDLFIIDQHASDEKYNFETLQKTTILVGQPLIIPQKLELTAGERLVMQENAEIFQKNGFGFKTETNQDAQDSIYLTKVPSSRNWTFDASDVSELIFMLTDAPHILCRPSRVRQMFASRACRKSIMVGTALTETQMMKLVNHMAEMDQPWNCPHGRPTMRHLADLSMIVKPIDKT